MRRRLFFWELAGFLWTVAAGTALHFLYAWSGGSSVAAAFSGVNESAWEHMKLLFVPVLAFTVVQLCAMGRTYPDLLAARAVSTLTGLALIPVLFYTYTGVLGYDVTCVNIGIFALAALGLFGLDLALLRRGRLNRAWMQVAGLLVLWGLAFVFVWCTFHPVRLGLWRDPVTGGFGIV